MIFAFVIGMFGMLYYICVNTYASKKTLQNLRQIIGAALFVFYREETRGIYLFESIAPLLED